MMILQLVKISQLFSHATHALLVVGFLWRDNGLPSYSPITVYAFFIRDIEMSRNFFLRW